MSESSFNPNQLRGQPKNKGQFRQEDKGDPEASLDGPAPEAESVFVESNRKLRGHQFYTAAMKKWPAMYSQDSLELADIPFQAHYFVGGADWYVSELDQDTGRAFGWADMGVGMGEYGYFNLPELERTVVRPSGFPQTVERDMDFKAGTRARDIIEKFKDAPVSAAA